MSDPIFQFKPHLKQDRKPILSKRVLSGLKVIAGNIEAGDVADFMGNDLSSMDAESRAAWADVLRACEWIRKMQRYVGQKKERSANT